MNGQNFFTLLVIFSGSIFAVLFAIAQLVRKEPWLEKNWWFIAFFCVLGIVLFFSGIGEFFWLHKEILYVNVSCLFSIAGYWFLGPLAYKVFHYPSPNQQVQRRLGGFIPSAIALFVLCVYLLLNKSYLQEEYYWDDAWNVLLVLDWGSGFYVLAYFCKVFYDLWRILPNLSNHHFQVYALLFFVFTLMTVCIVDLSFEESKWADMLATCILIILFLFESRYPGLLSKLSLEVQYNKDTRSRILDIDMSGIETKLQELMQEKELYRNEGLTLGELAEHIGLSVHQVSEFLNHHLQLGFYAYVNQFRVVYACKLLLEQPRLSVTAVAYEAGFNTNSVFYKSFRNNTGMSPGAYRKHNQNQETMV
ncbi:MAG: helix-turn-helix domain-containing protein [Spirochaetota bacterium]